MTTSFFRRGREGFTTVTGRRFTRIYFRNTQQICNSKNIWGTRSSVYYYCCCSPLFDLNSLFLHSCMYRFKFVFIIIVKTRKTSGLGRGSNMKRTKNNLLIFIIIHVISCFISFITIIKVNLLIYPLCKGIIVIRLCHWKFLGMVNKMFCWYTMCYNNEKVNSISINIVIFLYYRVYSVYTYRTTYTGHTYCK